MTSQQASCAIRHEPLAHTIDSSTTAHSRHNCGLKTVKKKKKELVCSAWKPYCVNMNTVMPSGAVCDQFWLFKLSTAQKQGRI
jgi:hypothetical protein